MKFLLSALILSSSLLVFSLSSPNTPCANTGSCLRETTPIVENNVAGTFLGQSVLPPVIDESQDYPLVLGAETGPNAKHIYVDLETQKLYAYDGDDLFMQTLVSTGRWGRTPPGEYKIWMKIRSTRMSGGEGNDAYDLPNVPYVMFFYNDSVPKSRGYSFHGAYWHNNFGYTMSHGCVNMREIDAHTLYDWANPVSSGSSTTASDTDPGTEVSICSKISINNGGAPQCVE